MLNSKRFTLIEILVAIVILGFLSSIVIVTTRTFSHDKVSNLIKNITIPVTFTVKGKSNIKIEYIDKFDIDQTIEKDITETELFQIDFPSNTNINLQWMSYNDDEVKITIDYNNISKNMSGKEGNLFFKTPHIPPTQCFIKIINKSVL